MPLARSPGAFGSASPGGEAKPRNVRVGLIQTRNPVNDESQPVAEIQEAAFQYHLPFIDQAGEAGVQILGLQEIFNGPYFCPGQDVKWYAAAESVPGPLSSSSARVAQSGPSRYR